MNEPTAFAEVNHETSRLVEQSFNLSPGGSLGVSPDERWESITAVVSPNDYKEAGLTANAANLAPTCINAVEEWGFIQVYNRCGFDIRVKVVMAFGPDSPCHIVVDGTRHNISPAFGRIDRVELC
ncbi:hypothetical protein [Corynebacterium cystitidis]|uniref:hypothetical protein n=1 Tax=Corynebacterium cystitidis TaxID=35757 RepID=UPI00211E7BA9|nr:hypothetical protein [Corynebacterium cystitidis]